MWPSKCCEMGIALLFSEFRALKVVLSMFE